MSTKHRLQDPARNRILWGLEVEALEILTALGSHKVVIIARGVAEGDIPHPTGDGGPAQDAVFAPDQDVNANLVTHVAVDGQARDVAVPATLGNAEKV